MGVNSANSTYSLIFKTHHKEQTEVTILKFQCCNPQWKKMKPYINLRIKTNPTKLIKMSHCCLTIAFF